MARHSFPVEHQREAGRKRAAQFTQTQQREAGKKRASQASFLPHLQQIAPDGFWSWSAYMRAPCGLRLLRADQIAFLRPEQLTGPNGTQLTPREQRLLFGLYCWKAVWEDLPRPPLPSDEEYLREATRVHARVSCGLPLAHALDGIYTAPNDYGDPAGVPWSHRKQRKLFRAALEAAREYALRHAHTAVQAPQDTPASRHLGQRRPMQTGTPPLFQRGPHTPSTCSSSPGRPDLPAYALENVRPTRPYGIARTASHIVGFWLAPESPASDAEREGEEESL